MNPYKEHMQQVWVSATDNSIKDQYGFVIKIKGKDDFWLFSKGLFLLKTFSLEAAKEISLVLINDRVMNG